MKTLFVVVVIYSIIILLSVVIIISHNIPYRKLFIGGLPAAATKEDLMQYFGQYGEVEMCTIKTDQFSGASRGFGFLIFKEVSAVDQVGTHTIFSVL